VASPPASWPASTIPHALSHDAHWSAALSIADTHAGGTVHELASTPTGHAQASAEAHALSTAETCDEQDVVMHEAQAVARTPPLGQFVIEKPPSNWPASPFDGGFELLLDVQA
jgi:hypothetical protein